MANPFGLPVRVHGLHREEMPRVGEQCARAERDAEWSARVAPAG